MENIDLTKKNRNIIKHKNLLSHIKMGRKVLAFGGIELKKKLLPLKNLFFLQDIDIEKVLVSNKISSSQKNVNTLLATCIMIIITMIKITYNAS